MTIPTPEAAPTAADLLNDALIKFTTCVGDALDICSYGLIHGESYVPFDPDEEDECEEGENECEQAWVRVNSITPTTVQENMEGSDCSFELSIDLEVGVLRCYGIEEDGEAPSAAQALTAAAQSMTDMRAILDGAMCCEAWEALNVGTWSPVGPLGGQYGGIWTFTAIIPDTGLV